MIGPLHRGIALTTGALTLSVLPQLSSTVGGVGATASAGQATVELVGAGITTVGGSTVVVCVQV